MNGVKADNQQSKQYLVMIDFDHTIVDKNTDTWICRLFPGGKVPDELKRSYHEHKDWHFNMQEKFDELHAMGIQPSEIKRCQTEIPLVKGMDQVLRHLGRHDFFHVIVTSDSNSFFIDSILEVNGLSDMVDRVLSNPACFDETQRLILKPHHEHTCVSCPSNMCKRKILENYLSSCADHGKQFDHVLLIGDGSNDYCPCEILREKDTVFARNGYKLHKKLNNNEDAGLKKVNAVCEIWENGEDLLQRIKSITIN